MCEEDWSAVACMCNQEGIRVEARIVTEKNNVYNMSSVELGIVLEKIMNIASRLSWSIASK